MVDQFRATRNGRLYTIVYHHEIGWITQRPFVVGLEIGVVKVGRILDIHPESVRRLIRSKHIPARKVGTKWMIRERDVMKMANWYTGQRGPARFDNHRMI